MSHAERNASICTLYTSGVTIPALAERFTLSRQRVRQLLISGGVWKRADARPVFLGVDVTQEAKDKLKELADQQQTSMSRLAAQAIDTLLEEGK